MNKRQVALLDKLNRLGRLSLEEEAGVFGVSSMTIRRDLAMFEERGVAIRTQGGAIPAHPDPTKLAGGGGASPVKRQIARRVVERIPDGSTLMLSAGSTTLEVARQLAVAEKSVCVITNSLTVAAALFQTPVQVILTGGSLRSDSLDLVGPVAEKNIDEYYIDILISGCDGAMAGEGFFTHDLNLASMERKSVQKSRNVIIVTESAKFGRPSFAKFASVAEVSAVITDAGLSQADRESLQVAGVEVVCD